MTPQNLTQSLKAEANRLGFAIAGCCPAQSTGTFEAFVDWLEAGFDGEMSYLKERQQAYQHPKHVMPEVVSILMLGMNYQTRPPSSVRAGQGRVSRYAWSGTDYHDVIHDRLKKLKRFVLELDPNRKVRGVVDTAPLLEREFAQQAGLGWSAKNTMLINKEIGSWFFLAALLIDVELEFDAPFTQDHCGTCTACLEACPTNAFASPGVLDATKCISYLTIEHRSPIPMDLREGIGEWVFGCDVCQDVCPWNRKAELSGMQEFEPMPELNPLELRELFFLDEEQFRQRFRKTPLWRTKRKGILRNAAIVLGNQPDERNLPALSRGLEDSESLVRGASAWALGKHGEKGKSQLSARFKLETNLEVCAEIELGLRNDKSQTIANKSKES